MAELQALTASDPSPNNMPPSQPQLAIRPSDSISQENLNAIPVPRSGSGINVQGGEIAGTRQFDAQIRAAQREQVLQDERQAAAIRQMRAQQEAELAEQRRAEAAYKAEVLAEQEAARKREIEANRAYEEAARTAQAEYARERAEQDAKQRETERLQQEARDIARRKIEEANLIAEEKRRKAEEAERAANAELSRVAAEEARERAVRQAAEKVVEQKNAEELCLKGELTPAGLIVYCSTAIGYSSRNASLYTNRAKSYFLKGDYENSMKDAGSAISIEPMNAAPYYYRGASFFNLQQYDKALIDLNKAIELKVLDADAYLMRARILAGRGKYDEALKDCDKAQEIAPTSWSPDNTRGSIYFDMNNFAVALKSFEAALKKDPNSSLIIGNRDATLQKISIADAGARKIEEANQRVRAAEVNGWLVNILSVLMLLGFLSSFAYLFRKFDIYWLIKNPSLLNADQKLSEIFIDNSRVDENAVLSLVRSEVSNFPFLKKGFFSEYGSVITLHQVAFERIEISWDVNWTASFGYAKQEVYYENGTRKERRVYDWRPSSGRDVGSVETHFETTGTISQFQSNKLFKKINISAAADFDDVNMPMLGSFVRGELPSSDKLRSLVSGEVDASVNAGVRRHQQGDATRDWHWSGTTSVERVSVTYYPIILVKFSGVEGEFKVTLDPMNKANVFHDNNLPTEKLTQFYVIGAWVLSVLWFPLIAQNSKIESFAMTCLALSWITSVGCALLFHIYNRIGLRHAHHKEISGISA